MEREPAKNKRGNPRSQTRAAQTHAAQTRAAQTRAAQAHAVQTRAAQTRAAQAHAVQTRAAQAHAVQTRAAQAHAVQQTRAAQTRTAQAQVLITPATPAREAGNPLRSAAVRARVTIASYREADSTVSPAITLYRRAAGWFRQARRRWLHIRREQDAKRFPESDRAAVQFLLFLREMLPMLGSLIRERTWRRRKRAVSRFGHLRAWLEHHKTHPAAFLGIAGAVAVIALFCSLYTFGTTVTYDGAVVAKVTSEMAVKSACTDLERATRQALGTSYSIDQSLIQYSSGLMARRDVVDGDAFEEELSDDIGLITYGYALYVDGELIGATPYEGALQELLQQLKDGISDENTISCDFQENVEVKAEYVPTDKIMNLGYLAEQLYSTKTQELTYTVQKGDTWSEIADSHGMTSSELLSLNPGYNIDKLSIGEVLTISAAVPYLTMTVTERERYVEELPYDIAYVDSANLYKGDYKVLSPGQNGTADVVANVTYVNGEETNRTVLSSVTLTNPVTEQQACGTKERPTWLPTGTFRWPCSGHITSYFGYRHLSYSYASTYHEGIDIANRTGTPIYAADGGTVTYSGWMSGYGYLVIINHGNGYETYYGHNSSLLVSVGQHVYKGQQISRMGSTGNSTGTHCHFGVYYHGVAKNPLKYLP
jgi:murein DD-endopeptidase MepM/ murein hydrolase activator NlpD